MLSVLGVMVVVRLSFGWVWVEGQVLKMVFAIISLLTLLAKGIITIEARSLDSRRLTN